MKQGNLMSNIELYLENMPWYIKEFYYSRLSIPLSYRTLYEYLKEYKRFLNWLFEADITSIQATKDIPIEILAELSKSDMEAYFIYLREKHTLNFNQKSGSHQLSEATVNRTRVALSSLFKFLTEETENDNKEPYFYRNVMKKIKFKNKKNTLSSRAANIKPKLFLGNETKEFLHYIEHDYPLNAQLSARAYSSYKKNLERDLAILALFLSTGIRLSELINTNLNQINLNTMSIEVTRKGGAKDMVAIAPFAKPYILAYLDIRKSRYRATAQDVSLFLTLNGGVPGRPSGRTIERMVEKYSSSFKVRVTPHKLRHTFATRLYEKTKNPILVANQLGHTDGNTQTVATYAHILDDATVDALSDL